jgi:hypothetical protein
VVPRWFIFSSCLLALAQVAAAFGVSWICRAVDIGGRYCSFVVDANIV